MGTCRGIDVSTYQAAQNWAAHKANGVAFAFAKASEGQHTRDSMFAVHMSGIKRNGLVPGAYHFAWPNQSAVTEAANYIAAVKPYAGPGFLHWLDLERRSDGANYRGVSDRQILAYASRWIVEVTAAFPGQRVGIYTSSDDIAKGHVPAGVPLWYPAYPGPSCNTYAEAEARSRPSPGGRTSLIWQFTSDPATGPNLDLNLCYMSAADLRTWAAGEDAVMALTSDDVGKVADAVVAKLIAAGGVLEGGDLDRVYSKIFSTDDYLNAPKDASDYATNKYWAFKTHVEGTTTASRHAADQTDVIAAQAKANGEALSQILALLGQLGQGGLLDQIKTELEALHLGITVTES